MNWRDENWVIKKELREGGEGVKGIFQGDTEYVNVEAQCGYFKGTKQSGTI